MSLRSCVALAVILGVLVSVSSLSQAQTYQRGYLGCEDFEHRKRTYLANPNHVGFQSGYGQCLIAKGEVGAGLNLWNDIMLRASSREKIRTAFLYAEYIETGGEFDGLEYKNLTEAARAYEVVIANINFVNSPGAPNNTPYPHGGNWEAERAFEIELTSYYTIPYLYMIRAQRGGLGHDRELKFNSVGYTGDRTLETYYDYYKNNMTLISLRKVAETAQNCLKVPYKRHFYTDSHENAMEICRIIKTAAEGLYPLEEQRLNAADKGSCRRDILNCEEYQDIINQMIAIIGSMWAALEDVGDVFAKN